MGHSSNPRATSAIEIIDPCPTVSTADKNFLGAVSKTKELSLEIALPGLVPLSLASSETVVPGLLQLPTVVVPLNHKA